MQNFRTKIQKYFIWLIGILIVVNALIIFIFNLNKSHIISLVSVDIAFIAAILAVIAIAYQLKSNNEWNQRQIALTSVYDRTAFSKAVAVLKKEIKYTNITEPIPVADMHQHICGNSDCNGALLDLTSQGIKTSNSIYVMLNYYEYLAVGVESHVMDEEVVKNMIKGSLLHTYKIFSLYINHLRSPRHNKKDAYLNLEKLAKRWEREDEVEFKKREATI